MAEPNPISEKAAFYKQRRGKNLLTMVLLLAMMVSIYFLTMVRLQQGTEMAMQRMIAEQGVLP